MKPLLLAFSALLIVGCVQQPNYVHVNTPVVLFPIERFKPMGKYDIKNVGTFTENNVTYVRIPMNDFTSLVGEYKHVKDEYNLLYDSISTFNENLPQQDN